MEKTKDDYVSEVLSDLSIEDLLDTYKKTSDKVLMKNIINEIHSRCSIDPKLV